MILTQLRIHKLQYKCGEYCQAVYTEIKTSFDRVWSNYIIIEMQQQMQLKQSYLRQEILEKQYDPQLFIEFLNDRLNIGDDLSLCTFQQLQTVVQDFLSIQKQKESLQYPNLSSIEPITTNDEISKSLQQQPIPTIAKPRNMLFEKYNFTEPQFTKTFQCIKINDRLNKGKNIRCEVCNPQRKNTGGFFGIGAVSYLEFEVRTNQLGWVVGRRYSDFVWLRNFLRKMYPALIIPPIPEKKASKKTQRHVEKRMRILEFFLNDLISIPQLANNKFVQGFLKLKEGSKLSQLKEEGDNLKLPLNPNNIETVSGEVSVNFSLENKAYLQEMKKVVPDMEKLYKQITRQGKALQAIQTDQVNTLYEMGNLFAELHEKSRQVLNRVPKAKGLAKLNDLYITLNNMTIEWGNLIRGQFQILQKNFNTFFKYVRNDLHGYFQVFQLQAAAEEEFCRYKIALDKKKEKIYSQFDASKWDLPKQTYLGMRKEVIHQKAEAFKMMLPKENKQLERLRVNNALYVSQLFQSGDTNFLSSASKFQENFKEFAIKVKVNTQQIGELWSEMAQCFSGEGKAKQLKQKPADMNRGDEILDD